MERESFIQGGGRLIVINFLLILIVISLILDPFGLNGRTSVTNQRNLNQIVMFSLQILWTSLANEITLS